MNSQNNCISVIVPIYKTAAYLPKCMDSLLGQTYPNLEIILVDDGSPDNCPTLCDDYAAKNSRIKVIHQKNAGLSAARNAGLNVATGAYVGFVDSDDWISPDMFETLLYNALKFNAEVSICNIYYCKDEEVKAFAQGDTTILMSEEEVLKNIVGGKTIASFSCNKLFKVGLFKEIKYPVGCVYEDIAIMHLLVAKAKRIVCTYKPKYYYRYNPQGLTCNWSWKSDLGYLKATEAVSLTCLSKGYQEAYKINRIFYLDGIVGATRRILKGKVLDKEANANIRLKEYQIVLRKEIGLFLKSHSLLKRKIFACIFCVSLSFLKVIYGYKG